MRVGTAITVSLGVHALLVAVATLLTRETLSPTPIPPRPAIDTRVRLDAEPVKDVSPPTLVATPPEPEPPAPVEQPTSPAAEDAPATRDGTPARNAPALVSVPSVLPDAVLAHIRRFANTPTPVVDPAVRPASAVRSARPAHGALATGQRVVYLLDASGSMGEWGKFAAAREVVAATAALQPPGVTVKVVVYAATAEVVAPAELAGRSPVGRGNHLEGLRLALDQGPDFVVWFTDAADPPTAAVTTQLRRAGKSVTLVVARVGVTGVSPPTPFR